MSTPFLNKIKKIYSIKTIALIRSISTAFSPDRQQSMQIGFYCPVLPFSANYKSCYILQDTLSL